MSPQTKISLSWLVVFLMYGVIAIGATIILKDVLADTIQSSVTVGNEPPTVGTVILNGGNDIVLAENTTVTVIGTTTVTDGNGYNDITAVTSTLYLNNTTCSSGLADPNWCYYISSCATSNCSGSSCDVTCSANVWFIAEPTSPTTSYPSADWQMDITVVDSGNNTDTGTTSQELLTLYALDVDGSISYGTIYPGGTSTEQLTHATNTGNYQIDVALSGVDMDDGSGHTIAVGQQKYSSSSNMGDWVGTALTTTASPYNLDLPKPTATTSNSYDDLYWMIKIPDPQYPGTYTGTNTISAIDAI
ncbi:hypothetical protein J7K24_01655 [bacterium]|nr:hypothetical protein [bacterium]